MWLGFPNLSFMMIKEAQEWVHGLHVRQDKKEVVVMVLMTRMWVIWCFRNGLIFQTKKYRKDMLVDSLFCIRLIGFFEEQKGC